MQKYSIRVNESSFEDAIYALAKIPFDQRQRVTSLSISSPVPLYEHYFDFMDDGWTHYEELSSKIKQLALCIPTFKSLKQLTLMTGHELLAWNQMQGVKAGLDKLNLERINVIVKTKKEFETVDQGWLETWKNDPKVTINFKRKWCSIM